MPAVQPSDILAGHAAKTLDASAVRAMRENKGYSLEKLSLTCGLAAFELAEIESGRDTDPAKLRRIASALMLPEDAFIAAH
jgi:transcriptional regulator with XRE-family HTH domain